MPRMVAMGRPSMPVTRPRCRTLAEDDAGACRHVENLIIRAFGTHRVQWFTLLTGCEVVAGGPRSRRSPHVGQFQPLEPQQSTPAKRARLSTCLIGLLPGGTRGSQMARQQARHYSRFTLRYAIVQSLCQFFTSCHQSPSQVSIECTLSS
jgi:hypothetical protein